VVALVSRVVALVSRVVALVSRVVALVSRVVALISRVVALVSRVVALVSWWWRPSPGVVAPLPYKVAAPRCRARDAGRASRSRGGRRRPASSLRRCDRVVARSVAAVVAARAEEMAPGLAPATRRSLPSQGLVRRRRLATRPSSLDVAERQAVGAGAFFRRTDPAS